MLLMATAALLAAPADAGPTPGAVVVQARATVRIVSGVRLRLSEAQGGDIPPPRDATIRTDAGQQPAKLIEFQ
jgi:hypothetical protein